MPKEYKEILETALEANRQECLRLKTFRRDNCITQKQVKDVSFISTRTISSIETGEYNARVHTLEIYKAALNLLYNKKMAKRNICFNK